MKVPIVLPTVFNPNSGQTYEPDGAGCLRCKVCGKDGLSRTQMATRGHQKSKRHKDALLKGK